MKNLTNSFLSLGFWSYTESFGFNTDILATNPIDLSVVLSLLIFFFFLERECVPVVYFKNRLIQPTALFLL